MIAYQARMQSVDAVIIAALQISSIIVKSPPFFNVYEILRHALIWAGSNTCRTNDTIQGILGPFLVRVFHCHLAYTREAHSLWE